MNAAMGIEIVSHGERNTNTRNVNHTYDTINDHDTVITNNADAVYYSADPVHAYDVLDNVTTTIADPAYDGRKSEGNIIATTNANLPCDVAGRKDTITKTIADPAYDGRKSEVNIITTTNANLPYDAARSKGTIADPAYDPVRNRGIYYYRN